MNEARFREAERRLWDAFGTSAKERRVHLDALGATVRVQELGDGPPVLFVHGASNAGSSWIDLVTRLDGFRCILLDRPGCGLSDPLSRPPRTIDAVETYADTLIPAVLDALDVPRAQVIATSYGGYFALRAAAARPDQIERVVEFSWTVGAPIEKVPFAMRIGGAPGLGWLMARVPPTERAVRMILRQVGLRSALETGRFTQAHLDWFVALQRDTHTMRNEFESSPQLVRPLHGFNDRVLLSEQRRAGITTPIQFLWGADDPNGGCELARAFTAPFPNAEFECWSGAGHAPWIDDPDRAAAATRAFLAG